LNWKELVIFEPLNGILLETRYLCEKPCADFTILNGSNIPIIFEFKISKPDTFFILPFKAGVLLPKEKNNSIFS